MAIIDLSLYYYINKPSLVVVHQLLDCLNSNLDYSEIMLPSSGLHKILVSLNILFLLDLINPISINRNSRIR